MPSIPSNQVISRIGDYLHCSAADIQWAIKVQAAELATGNTQRLGEILLQRAVISEEELDRAVKTQCLDRLRGCRFLAALSDEDLVPIREICEDLELEAGEDLFKEGQRGDSMYIVATGCIVKFRRKSESEATPLGIASPGAVLGEMGYFTNGTRAYSACALKPTVLLKIRYDQLARLSTSIPALTAGMLDFVTGRTRQKAAL